MCVDTIAELSEADKELNESGQSCLKEAADGVDGTAVEKILVEGTA